MTIEWMFIVVSVSINLVFIFYARWLINILKTREEEFLKISDIISGYVSHVKGVHEMEMFYGDKTLVSLIEHGNVLIENIEELDYVMFEENPPVAPTPEQEE